MLGAACHVRNACPIPVVAGSSNKVHVRDRRCFKRVPHPSQSATRGAAAGFLLPECPSMAQFEWNDAMTTGLDEIDEAHKTLIAGINALSDAMQTGQSKDSVLRTLRYLGEYAKQHFAHEEGCMNAHRCPMAHANKRAHAEFLEFFTQMQVEVEMHGVTAVTVVALQDALGNWLRQHIMRVDTGLLACVSHGVV